MSLRTIPNLLVFRPAEGVETALCMRVILHETARPSALLLTRQSVPVLPGEYHALAEAGVPQGGYILRDTPSLPDITLFATGSEVTMALEVSELLGPSAVRVVSLPCWELFFEQPADYQKLVLGDDDGLRVSLEAGTTLGWERFTGRQGLNIGVDRFGASGTGKDVRAEVGLTVHQVVEQIRKAANDFHH